MSTPTPYEKLGAAPGIRALVQRFYALMDELPEAYTIRQMHPEDLSGSEQRLFEYLSGWLGGPSLYTDKHGHPRLRMRHAPYDLDTSARDAWMLCMTQALSELVTDTELRDPLIHTFAQMANHLVNVLEPTN